MLEGVEIGGDRDRPDLDKLGGGIFGGGKKENDDGKSTDGIADRALEGDDRSGLELGRGVVDRSAEDELPVRTSGASLDDAMCGPPILLPRFALSRDEKRMVALEFSVAVLNNNAGERVVEVVLEGLATPAVAEVSFKIFCSSENDVPFRKGDWLFAYEELRLILEAGGKTWDEAIGGGRLVNTEEVRSKGGDLMPKLL